MNPYPSLSFNEIYSEFYRKSFAFVKSYVHDEMAAEDIVSDSMIKLWEQMKSERIDPISPFLFKMLKNSALDYLKHLGVKRNVHTDIKSVLIRDLELRQSSLEATNPIEIFSEEIQLLIEQTLLKLPERTREIFMMSRFNGKSHKEVADHFNIGVKGVEYHMGQAIRLLRLNLKDYLPVLVWLLVPII